jgi:hypothetical protein
MNNDRTSLVEQLLDHQTAKKMPAGDEETERFYAFVPGVQDRAQNIEFRKREGAWPFLEYSYLVGGEAVHAGEFVLRFASGERVTVRGRHLRAMYEKILRHRVVWVREGEADEQTPDSDPFVDEIEGPVREELTQLP